MSAAVPFTEYVGTLGRLTSHIDPTASTPEAEAILTAAMQLADLSAVSVSAVADAIEADPSLVRTLGLVVGLSQEKLKNSFRDEFDTTGWMTFTPRHSRKVVEWFDAEFDLLRMLNVQLEREYSFGDVLVARAGSRVTATQAGRSGRRVEDEIEAIARDLGLECQTRTRFAGRNGRTAPCDLVIPGSGDAQIVVAAKGFDSTGSKLTDAVREIEEMAEIRLPRQFVIAVIDGIGWKSRRSDLRRIHSLWESQQIDGMYTLATLDQFRDDIEEAAKLRQLI